jgi:hypothetical protein
MEDSAFGANLRRGNSLVVESAPIVPMAEFCETSRTSKAVIVSDFSPHKDKIILSFESLEVLGARLSVLPLAHFSSWRDDMRPPNESVLLNMKSLPLNVRIEREVDEPTDTSGGEIADIFKTNHSISEAAAKWNYPSRIGTDIGALDNSGVISLSFSRLFGGIGCDTGGLIGKPQIFNLFDGSDAEDASKDCQNERIERNGLSSGPVPKQFQWIVISGFLLGACGALIAYRILGW